MLHRGNKLFLFYSGSGCYTDDYAIGYLEASDKADPLDTASWIKHPRPFLTRNDSAARIAPGHNSFFRPPGSNEDWIVYHANPRPGLGCGAARAPHAQPLRWTPDGRPTFIN